MPLQIIHQDITKMVCDAIVNPTDGFYSGRGGADAQIHKAAGIGLELACAELPFLDVGKTEVTPGFDLPAKYVIHTTGPVWEDGDFNEPMLLRSCYLNSLIRAKRLGCRSVAFPLIASGTYGFPKDKVLRIATEAISDFLLTADGDMDVYVCVIDRDAYELSLGSELKSFLNRYGLHTDEPAGTDQRENAKYSVFVDGAKGYGAPTFSGKTGEPDLVFNECISFSEEACKATVASLPEAYAPSALPSAPKKEETGKKAKKGIKLSLDDLLKHHDDTFAVLLLKLIDMKKMDDVEVYKKANLHKNILYNIKNKQSYKPSKQTVVSFAVALELTMDETEELLRSAGFALARNNDFDLIVRFFIENGVYDVFTINEALYQYDQMLLGSGMKSSGE